VVNHYTSYVILACDFYIGISEFEKGYSCITKLVKGMNDDLLGDLHRISDMLKNHSCQLGVRFMRLMVLGRLKHRLET
jgi:hypothetical protein